MPGIDNKTFFVILKTWWAYPCQTSLKHKWKKHFKQSCLLLEGSSFCSRCRLTITDSHRTSEAS